MPRRYLKTFLLRLPVLSGLALFFMVVSLAAAPDYYTGEIVSVNDAGALGSYDSKRPVISADGNQVAFYSSADNLVPGDTNSFSDVFIRNRYTGTTSLVSVGINGKLAKGGDSSFVAMTPDGRFVAFSSSAKNLVSNDLNFHIDIFVRDLYTGMTTRVSVNSTGKQGNAHSVYPGISADGRFVTFWSEADNLVDNDTNGVGDVFVHDRQTGITSLISLALDGTQGNGVSKVPSISADGRYIAFSSDASNLVSGDNNRFFDVFRYDQETGETVLVSVTAEGTPGDSGSSYAKISGDGNVIAFASSSHFVDGQYNDVQVFAKDLTTGMLTRVSHPYDGATGEDTGHGLANISQDGRFVVFDSVDRNLVPGDNNSGNDVFLYDLTTDIMKRVSLNAGGFQLKGGGFDDPFVSADGSFVVFDIVDGLVAGDHNEHVDIGLAASQFDPVALAPTPVNLVSNGGFELDANEDGIPDGWDQTNPSQDSNKCYKKPKGKHPPASKVYILQGKCAYQFKGSADEQSLLTYSVPLNGVTLNPGDTLTFSGFVSTRGNVDAQAIVRVNYVDSTLAAETIEVNINSLSSWYAAFASYNPNLTLELDGAVASVDIQLLNNGTSGKVRFDAIALLHQPSNQSGVLPLPGQSLEQPLGLPGLIGK